MHESPPILCFELNFWSRHQFFSSEKNRSLLGASGCLNLLISWRGVFQTLCWHLLGAETDHFRSIECVRGLPASQPSRPRPSHLQRGSLICSDLCRRFFEFRDEFWRSLVRPPVVSFSFRCCLIIKPRILQLSSDIFDHS